MLVLTFRVAEVPYAVSVMQVVEVVPRVALRGMPHAPAYLAGLLRYRGGAVPVVDLGLLLGESACRERLDTRIILVDSGLHGGPGPGFLGLIAERVDDVQVVDEAKRTVAGLEIEQAPYLGPVYETEGGLLQLIEPSMILKGMVIAASGHGEKEAP
jgi:chemotaxis-related protein WspB